MCPRMVKTCDNEGRDKTYLVDRKGIIEKEAPISRKVVYQTHECQDDDRE